MYRVIQGDNRETLKLIPDNSIDAIVTDPPYGIDFLGKDWDANTGSLETYKECLRVLKPGGHILAFSAARTYHHLAVTIEQAGFEIRDQIMWIYSSGFPKSQDVGKSIDRAAGKAKTTIKNGTKKGRGEKIEGFDLGSGTRCPECKRDSNARYSCDKGNDCGMVFKPESDAAKQWAGWGTALKPAHEPICMARKPLKQSVAKNVQEYGTGALNIDATRIPLEEGDKFDIRVYKDNQNNEKRDTELTDVEYGEYEVKQPSEGGRFPSNVIGDIPDYQKYFYCPKVSRKERHTGFDLDKKEIATEASMLADMGGYYVDENNNETKLTGKNIWLPQTGRIYVHGLKEEYRKWCETNNKTPNSGNNHPTVKPVELMKYLIKLVTPPGGTVLDPFNGSGSTGMAAVSLGHNYIGCELDPNYVNISLKRIEAYNKPEESNNTFNDIFEEK